MKKMRNLLLFCKSAYFRKATMYIVGNEAVIARDRQYEVFTFDPADKTFIYENRSIYQEI